MNVTLDAQSVPVSSACMADLPGDDLALLGSAIHHDGEVSIVLLSNSLDISSGRLTFDHRAAVVLNQGTSQRTIFVTSLAMSPGDASGTSGDAQFLAELTDDLRDLGTQLLAEVRSRWPGALSPTKTSRKFVESPDNFWTVKIQPRAGSLALTVRGEPDRFRRFTSLDVKADQAGYSRFQLRTLLELPDAIDLLHEVPRRK